MIALALLATTMIGAASPDSCARPAAIITPIPPTLSNSDLQMARGPAQTIVLVSLDANGAVTEEHVTQSSGVLALDQAALLAARQSKYSPRMVDCKAAAGRYLFKVTFNK